MRNWSNHRHTHTPTHTYKHKQAKWIGMTLPTKAVYTAEKLLMWAKIVHIKVKIVARLQWCDLEWFFGLELHPVLNSLVSPLWSSILIYFHRMCVAFKQSDEIWYCDLNHIRCGVAFSLSPSPIPIEINETKQNTNTTNHANSNQANRQFYHSS